MQVAKNFTKEELECECCGLYDIDEGSLEKLQKLRDLYKKPLIVSSGCRCEKNNERWKGKLNSAHLVRKGKKCKGFDIEISRTEAYYFMKCFYKEDSEENLIVGFTGIGWKQKGKKRFIHVDDLTSEEGPRPIVWSY